MGLARIQIKYGRYEMRKIVNEAKRRGITIQMLLRAVVIPEWLMVEREKDPR